LSSAPASAVINLVHQAAEVFSSMEDHARETEARAQSLCKSALERLELAEKRIETVERERCEAINKLRDASKALGEVQSSIVAAEDRLTAAEFRAQAAEAEAREAKQALALVEEAIRSRLLSASPKAGPSLGTVV
jgi:chromosome segregation ATPase